MLKLKKLTGKYAEITVLQAELRQTILSFLGAEGTQKAAALGARAKAAVERRKGATERCAKDILSCLA